MRGSMGEAFIYINLVIATVHCFTVVQPKQEGDAASDSDESDGQKESQDEAFEDNLTICKGQCVEQWKTDFNVFFQKNYDEDFYEFPLDAIVTSNRKNFLAFCRMTMNKISCLKEQCGIHRRRIPWSPDVHLCLHNKRKFLSSLKCFNVTAEGAHNGCNQLCTKASSEHRLKPVEKTYLSGLKLEHDDNAQYKKMSRDCYFQICQYQCRKELMERLCDEEHRPTATDALHDYYAHDHLDQYQTLSSVDDQKMFPLMCRTLLPQRYQVENTANKYVKRDVEALKRTVKNRVSQMLSKK